MSIFYHIIENEVSKDVSTMSSDLNVALSSLSAGQQIENTIVQMGLTKDPAELRAIITRSLQATELVINTLPRGDLMYEAFRIDLSKSTAEMKRLLALPDSALVASCKRVSDYFNK